MRDIPCGTKGGVMINFEKIEVKLQEVALFINIMVSLGFEILSLYILFQIDNRLRKDYVYVLITGFTRTMCMTLC